MSWSSALRHLDRFLFEPVPPLVYAWLRIGLGLLAAATLLPYGEVLTFLYSDQGFYPVEDLRHVEGGLTRLSLLYLVTTPEGVAACYRATLLVALAYAAGLATRVTGPMLWLLWVSFVNRNLFAAYGAMNLLVILLFLVMWAPAGNAWSLDRWFSRRFRPSGVRPSRPPGPAWPLFLRLIRFQVCVMYLKSGLYKLMGRPWLDGTAVYYPLVHPEWRRFDFGWLLKLPGSLTLLGVFSLLVVAWECCFWLMILAPPTRRLALGLGVMIHGLQWITIQTGTFPPLLLTSYLAFLDPRRTAARCRLALRRLRAALRAGPTHGEGRR